MGHKKINSNWSIKGILWSDKSIAVISMGKRCYKCCNSLANGSAIMLLQQCCDTSCWWHISLQLVFATWMQDTYIVHFYPILTKSKNVWLMHNMTASITLKSTFWIFAPPYRTKTTMVKMWLYKKLMTLNNFKLLVYKQAH